jgi:dihydropteroate synthase
MEHLKLQTLKSKITLSSKGQLITIEKPVVMGILNITPDSFFDGGKHFSANEALRQTEIMLKEGALFIDIGAYSSRPKAIDISIEEELKRLIPIIELITKYFPGTWLSIDTFRSKVAKEAIEAGGYLINDISSGDEDNNMMKTVAELKVPYIMMHKKGTPQNMQINPHYDNIILEIIQYFTNKIKQAHLLGIKDLVIDPGFGFGKNLDHNFSLLKHLNDFNLFELPLLVGLSRKSMLQQTTHTTSLTALNATSSANTIALLNGANILRVHDVKEAVECINIVTTTYGAI